MIDVNIELKINSSQGNEIFLLQRVPESGAFEKTVLSHLPWQPPIMLPTNGGTGSGHNTFHRFLYFKISW